MMGWKRNRITEIQYLNDYAFKIVHDRILRQDMFKRLKWINEFFHSLFSKCQLGEAIRDVFPLPSICSNRAVHTERKKSSLKNYIYILTRMGENHVLHVKTKGTSPSMHVFLFFPLFCPKSRQCKIRDQLVQEKPACTCK